MRGEILSIGDEITSGQLLDTNSQWLSQRLEELGIRVLHHAAVGDDLEAMIAVFREAIARCDVIVATGGLGPTADDLTRDALAKATGRQLVLDAEALEHVRGLFARRQRPMPPQNELQALFPAGSRIVPNPHGTAPGIDLTVDRPGRSASRFFALPGVPAEMREMWEQTVATRLREAGAGQRIVRHRKIKCFGAGESQIESMLPDLIRRGRYPRVGINASQATIILRITAEETSEQLCDAAITPTVATIHECLGSLVFGEGEDELHHAVVRLLRQQGKTLATAEWGTAGLVGEWLDGITEAEGCYVGGLIVASEAALTATLEVPAAAMAQYTPASGEVAAAMAEACRRRFTADYGLAVSRFPRWEPASPQPVFLALASPQGVQVKSLPFASHPDLLKTYIAKQALNLARLALQAMLASPHASQVR